MSSSSLKRWPSYILCLLIWSLELCPITNKINLTKQLLREVLSCLHLKDKPVPDGSGGLLVVAHNRSSDGGFSTKGFSETPYSPGVTSYK